MENTKEQLSPEQEDYLEEVGLDSHRVEEEAKGLSSESLKREELSERMRAKRQEEIGHSYSPQARQGKGLNKVFRDMDKKFKLD